MEREPFSPPSPRSLASNQQEHHDAAKTNSNSNSNTANYWSIFSQGNTDQFARPKRGTPTRPHWRKNHRADDGSSIESSSNYDVVNELTSLLLTPPPRNNNKNSTRDKGNAANQNQHANNRGAALNNHATFNKSSSSPRRYLRERLQMSPLGSRSRSSNGFQQPILLQSMRHWDVTLPPLKKHVVGGKLVETLQGSLYGNDRERNLPVAKRKLTIELFGHDRDTTELWGMIRKHRNFSDLERNLGGGSSCGGGVSCGSGCEDDSSWELFKGASTDDFSIAKDDDDCHNSDADSSFVVNDGETDDRKYELAERDVVVLRVMKSRMVTPYDDEYGLGDNSINGGLKDRKWESQTMSDRTMSWMVGLETGDRDYYDRDDNASFSSGESFAKKHVRWTELSRTRLSYIELVREDFEANEVDLKMGVDARTVVQTFRFDDVNDYYGAATNRHEGNARTFARLFRLLKKLQKERAQRLATAHRDHLSEHDSYKQGGANDSFSFHEMVFGQESNTVAGNDNTSNGNDDSDDCDNEGEKVETDETVSILIEIVSASNLPPPEDRKSDRGEDFFVADLEAPPSSDPYVVVQDGKTDVHTTSFIADTINPVWTLSTGSLFLLQSNLVDFFESSNVLEFTVKSNKAMVGIEDHIIGTVMVHKTELLNGTGERKYYQILRPPTSSRSKNMVQNTADDSVEAPCLYLRYRQASIEDIEFMKTLKEETKKELDLHPEDGVYAIEAFLPPQLHTTAFLHQSKEKVEGVDEKFPRFRVKPTPNPENVPGTEWMTETQIEEVSKDHSTSWTMAGSGSTGKLYIEIVGCDGLTNPAQASGEKSDSFVNIVYEDSIVNTDVINDCLSPRWMPWSQRAFVMNMMHLSSQIFIGVFDHNNSNQGIDTSASAEANHDPLGRAVINLSSLQPRAIHTLTYNLYDSDDDNRECRGTITIRLRLAIDDERRALLSELSLRDHCYVSTVKGSDFRCALYSLTNSNQPLSFSLRNLTSHKKELLGYIEQTDHITGALAVVLLWRGHFPVTLNLDSVLYGRHKEIVLNLPLHSIVAFAWATILAWDLEKIFSFFWFVIGWAFLAELEDQRRHPSPWRRPRSYTELLRTLIFHKSKSNFGVLGRPLLRRTIHPNERLGEIERFESHEAVKAASRQKRLEKSNTEREKHQKRLLKEEEFMTRQDILGDQNHSSERNRKDDDVTARDTKKTTFSDAAMLASFDAILFPIQKILWKACRLVRVCSSVFLWKDSYLAFWITTLSFSASFLAFWIPWAWLIQWEFRLFVWPLFGPWMKLVDIYYIQREKNYPKGEEIISQSETEILENMYNRILGQDEWNAVCRENALKNKDMKRYMFGKCSMRVPIFQEERFPCEPAISSSSVPYNINPRPVHVARHIHGQRLKGDMIPYRNYNSNPGRGDGIATT